MLTRQEKTAIVGEISDALRADAAMLLVDYRGVATQPMRVLRERLAQHGGRIRVVKKTLLKRALFATDMPVLPDELFSGQVALVYGFSDAAAAAKILQVFRKELESTQPPGQVAFSLLGGLLALQVLDAQDVEALALLPSRQELLARLAGGVAAPLRGLVFVLSGPPRGFVQALRARREAMEGSVEKVE